MASVMVAAVMAEDTAAVDSDSTAASAELAPVSLSKI
jgi:hypothetical protein